MQTLTLPQNMARNTVSIIEYDPVEDLWTIFCASRKNVTIWSLYCTIQSRNKPQRTLEAEPEESHEESEQAYLDELLVPEPWELNNTARAGTEILFFNRVPKVGSQTFMELLRRLAIRNQFGKSTTKTQVSVNRLFFF